MKHLPTTMKKLLLINSSANVKAGHSRQLAQLFIKEWQANFPQTEVITRDVAAQPVPHLMEDSLEAIKTNKPIGDLIAEGQRVRKLSDELITELKSADTIVFGVPMYNFTIPTTLKAYIDLIVRKDETFGYNPQVQRPIGLLTDKQVVVITTGGGLYHDTPLDFLTPYLKTVFSMIGLDKNLTFIKANGLLKPDNEKSLQAAEQAIQAYVTEQASPKAQVNLSALEATTLGIFANSSKKQADSKEQQVEEQSQKTLSV